jgi:hypothetical protein
VFSVVNRAGYAVLRDLEEWSQVAAELVNQAQTLPADSPLRIRIQSNAALISMISDDVLFEPDSFRGVRDTDGNLQAAAVVTDRGDHLYLDYLATAPWNLMRNSPRSVREAATALVVELVKESMRNGYFGRIIADAVSGSSSFYERIGFVRTGFSSAAVPQMELIPQAASSLLRKRRNT